MMAKISISSSCTSPASNRQQLCYTVIQATPMTTLSHQMARIDTKGLKSLVAAEEVILFHWTRSYFLQYSKKESKSLDGTVDQHIQELINMTR